MPPTAPWPCRSSSPVRQLNMTQRYQHVPDELRRDVADKLGRMNSTTIITGLMTLRGYGACLARLRCGLPARAGHDSSKITGL